MSTISNASSSTGAPVKATAHIYVAIVSHGNEADITAELQPHTWTEQSARITTVILSNLPSRELAAYCRQHSIVLIENQSRLGFGANNNKIFHWLKNNRSIAKSDLFLCINPDIKVDTQSILEIADTMREQNLQIAAPNLVDANGYRDDNIRHYPSISDCVNRLFTKSKASTIDKTHIQDPTDVDWASGAFLCFRAGTYERLNGFDERYFMYYEDADICLRANRQGIPTTYIPNVTAMHKGARTSRNVFSRLGYQHIKSALRFILSASRSNRGARI